MTGKIIAALTTFGKLDCVTKVDFSYKYCSSCMDQYCGIYVIQRFHVSVLHGALHLNDVGVCLTTPTVILLQCLAPGHLWSMNFIEGLLSFISVV
jgi:hypothetical protein